MQQHCDVLELVIKRWHINGIGCTARNGVPVPVVNSSYEKFRNSFFTVSILLRTENRVSNKEKGNSVRCLDMEININE